MARHALLIFSLFLRIISVSATDSHGVAFQYPVAGLDVHFLDSVNVSWTSNFSSPTLVTFCQNNVTQDPIEETSDSVPTNGTKLFVMSFLNVSTCNWDIRPEANVSGQGLNSPAFVLQADRRATPSTFGLDQAAAATSSVSSSTTGCATSPTITTTPTVTEIAKSASATATSAPDTGKKVSNGLIAGIVVLVIALVIALSVLAFCFYRRHKRNASTIAPMVAEDPRSKIISTSSINTDSPLTRASNPSLPEMPNKEQMYAAEVPFNPAAQELNSTRPLQELDTRTQRDRAIELSGISSVPRSTKPWSDDNAKYQFPPR